jgi:hypothetical protein
MASGLVIYDQKVAVPSLRGIDLLRDGAGRERAARIDLRRPTEVREDGFDALVAEPRRSELRESLTGARRRREAPARRLRA